MSVPGSRLARGLAALAALGLASTASADVITFDDLPGFQTPVPDNYGGLIWANFDDVAGATMGPAGFRNGVVSGPNVAYNAGGNPATISVAAGSAFTLVGGDFTASSSPLTVEAVGSILGTPVAGDDVTFQLATSGPKLVTLDFAGVDSVTFSASGGTFVLDNLAVSPVPEPGTLALTAIGGLALVAAASRNRRKIRQKSPGPRDR
jgi:hypothetical protein